MARWCVQHAGYVISYVYPSFHGPESNTLRYAKCQGLAVPDMTNPDTAAYIKACAAERSERERFILEKTGEGLTQARVGALLGVSGSAVRQMLMRSCGKLRKSAKAIMGQTDFCICNLSQSALGSSIRKHLPKAKGLKLLDIGKEYTGAE